MVCFFSGCRPCLLVGHAAGAWLRSSRSPRACSPPLPPPCAPPSSPSASPASACAASSSCCSGSPSEGERGCAAPQCEEGRSERRHRRRHDICMCPHKRVRAALPQAQHVCATCAHTMCVNPQALWTEGSPADLPCECGPSNFASIEWLQACHLHTRALSLAMRTWTPPSHTPVLPQYKHP